MCCMQFDGERLAKDNLPSVKNPEDKEMRLIHVVRAFTEEKENINICSRNASCILNSNTHKMKLNSLSTIIPFKMFLN